MSVHYNPTVGSGVTSIQKTMYSHIDIPVEDISLLNTEDPVPENPGEIDHGNILGENMGYSPAIGVDYTADSKSDNTDLTDLSKDNLNNEPILVTKDEDEPVLDMSERDMVNFVPSAIVDYYNEAALTAKKRNNIPDSEFGLPRTRQYPLHDEAHVKQAIRMFGHCKDPEDRKTLASRIFEKISEMKLEVKIGKKNPLYKYAPKSMTEAVQVPESDDDDYKIFGFEVPMEKRTKEDVVKEHLRVNGNFYNTLFYGTDYAEAVKQLSEFCWFDYFYPNLKSHNFYQRLKCCLGGLATDREVYKLLKIRYPLDTTGFDDPIGNVEMTEELSEAFHLYVDTSYAAEANWFKENAVDHDHILYCLRLYSIMGMILNDPNFTMYKLSPHHHGILGDWGQHVQYHYDLLSEAADADEHAVHPQAQYLFDLFWNFHENPADPGVIVGNIAAMCTQMASAKNMTIGINESKELLSREDCAGYMVKELGLEDDIFLLPGSMEYPIINQNSVRMAMDFITKIDKADIPEYVKNLNRKYVELGCKFSITVDHPFAKYADRAVIDNMTHMLMEGDSSSVNDHGTSSGTTAPVEQGPWFLRNDVTGTVGRDILANKELGPNDKKMPSPDYERHEAVL